MGITKSHCNMETINDMELEMASVASVFATSIETLSKDVQRIGGKITSITGAIAENLDSNVNLEDLEEHVNELEKVLYNLDTAARMVYMKCNDLNKLRGSEADNV